MATCAPNQLHSVPKNVLVEIARKKQERGMVTQFKKYRAPQAKTTTRQTAASTNRKRTKAEALASQTRRHTE